MPYLARPLYRLLPLLYGCIGVALLVVSYFVAEGGAAALLGILGLATLVGALVIVLRRRDAKALREEYEGSPLRDRE